MALPSSIIIEVCVDSVQSAVQFVSICYFFFTPDSVLVLQGEVLIGSSYARISVQAVELLPVLAC